MISRLKEIRRDELVSGSIVLFFMIVLFNFLNYVFQISMARILGPADFGVLAALMSIIYILSIPGEAIQTIVSKYTSKFSAASEDGKIKDLVLRSFRRGFIFAGIIFIIFIPLSLILSKIIKIEFWLLVMTFIYIFYIFIIPIQRGALQGKKRFSQLGWSMVIEALVKVIFSIFLVLLGLRVYGAMGGVLAGSILVFLVLTITLKDVLKKERKTGEFDGAYKKSIPVFIAITSIVLMYSLDILFAKAFFSPEIAGKYSFISMIGKVIIFVSFSIGKAMLPISSEDFEKGKSTDKTFRKAFLLVSLISGGILLFYLLIPKMVVYVVSLFSDQYMEAAYILPIVGLAYALLSISNIIVIYKISINNISNIRRDIILPFVFVGLLVVLFSLFHENIYEFSLALLAANVIMFLYSLFLIRK